MTEYRVRWEIDIEADSPEEAARKALEIQRRYDSTATVFEVFQHFPLRPPINVATVDLHQDHTWEEFYAQGYSIAESENIIGYPSDSLWSNYKGQFAAGYADAMTDRPARTEPWWSMAHGEAYNLGRYEAEQG